MKNLIGLLTRSVILMAIVVSTGIAAATGMPLNKQLGEDLLADQIYSVTFNLYDSREAAFPLASQTYFPGEWQLTGEASSRMISVVLTQTDALGEQGELWLEVESEGLVVGERELLNAAPLGVTFGLGNTLNMSGNQIIDLGAPAIGTDAATMQYVQDQVATITGDDLGDHTATQNLDMDTTNRIVNLAAPVAASDAATRQFVLDQVGTIAGDNLGNHTATTDIDMGNTHQLINLPAPSTGTDAANMQYVLDQVAAVPGDNLGNHTATENIQLNGYYLSGDGDNEGLRVDSMGRVTMGTQYNYSYQLGVFGPVEFWGYFGSPPGRANAGSRLIWYPATAAFRVGYTNSSTNWYDWADQLPSTGTVSIVSGSQTVTGSGTKFDTVPNKMRSGYRAEIDGYEYIVESVQSDTELTLAIPAYTTASDVTMSINNLPRASFAAGEQTLATGEFSTAAGWNTVASGFMSTAFGDSTTASGIGSTALGKGTVARASFSTVIGQYNTEHPLTNSENQRLFVIGNGLDSSNREDAMVVERGGDVGIGISNPTVALDVEGTIKASTAIQVNGADVLTSFSELDPQVDTLTANKLCTADGTGSAIDCTTTLSDVETDPQVNTLTANKLCTADGAGSAIDCTTTLSTVETDPTVLASVKDGVSWAELIGIPADFADNVDNKGVTSVSTGTGLVGGTITDTGTLSVAVPLILSGSAGAPEAVIKATNTGTGYGIAGYGTSAGGYFKDRTQSGYAEVGSGDVGINAYGNTRGGHFEDLTSSAYADLATGDYGISAHGDTTGGYFSDLNNSGTAYLGIGDTGVKGVGTSYGGEFSTTGTAGRAVSGLATAEGAITNYGGWFTAHGDTGRAVGAIGYGASGYAFKGIADAKGDATNYGGHFISYGNTGIGVYGEATYGTTGDGVVGSGRVGVRGKGDVNKASAWGTVGEALLKSSGSAYGLYGYASASASGSTANLYGVYGLALDSTTGNKWAGYFVGNVNVTGTLSKGGGSFKIDHPLDPQNKTLSHSFVESPDMMNIYNGNVELNDRGEAVVEMPEWFEALNRDFRYQLTAIGGFAPIYVAEEMQNNSFRIAGGTAALKVSWQVTGIRQDPFAERNRIPVEEDKPDNERGSYLHPASYNMPEERSVEWARDPEGMTELKAPETR